MAWPNYAQLVATINQAAAVQWHLATPEPRLSSSTSSSSLASTSSTDVFASGGRSAQVANCLRPINLSGSCSQVQVSDARAISQQSFHGNSSSKQSELHGRSVSAGQVHPPESVGAVATSGGNQGSAFMIDSILCDMTTGSSQQQHRQQQQQQQPQTTAAPSVAVDLSRTGGGSKNRSGKPEQTGADKYSSAAQTQIEVDSGDTSSSESSSGSSQAELDKTANGVMSNGNNINAEKRRCRTMFSDWQLIELEWRFARNKYLTTADRYRIAEVLKLNQSQIKTWFQVSVPRAGDHIDTIPSSTIRMSE